MPVLLPATASSNVSRRVAALLLRGLVTRNQLAVLSCLRWGIAAAGSTAYQ